MALGHTIPELLDRGCELAAGTGARFHQWTAGQWQSWSFSAFRQTAADWAAGLAAWGVSPGERVALIMYSDVQFGLADMACLLSRLVTVPVEPSQPAASTRFMLQDSGARTVVVSSRALLLRLLRQQAIAETVCRAVVVDASETLSLPSEQLPDRLEIITSARLRQLGQSAPTRREIYPSDLATIVYTADESGGLKGAMLTHENLSADIWAAFSSMPRLTLGEAETALSFLPLNHIFARAFLYGHYRYGHHVYFSTPKRVMKHLQAVRPTIFITVPRLLEKVYEQVEVSVKKTRGWRGWLLRWGWQLAQQEQLSWSAYLQLWIARWLVFRPLRQAFGGRLRYFICGGAALKPEIAIAFHAVGLPVKQGYGLTETSSVVSYTRGRWSQPGTVGVPIPGVELRLAKDGEVLVKSPYTMQGYYHNPAATQAVLDADGWFHTGDYGEFSPEGLLRLCGCKKQLFKLSTGKYIMPQPIEAQLRQSALVQQAVVVGPQQKFCAALIFPERSSLAIEAASVGLSLSREALLTNSIILARYQTLVDRINAELPHWSTIKRFCLLEAQLDAQLSRAEIYQQFAAAIDSLYRDRDVTAVEPPAVRSRLPLLLRPLASLRGFAH
ncbi:MAG: AMP-binding protein [Leptolyngbya sp. SIO4C1]|nr:AMP-binding protein [Leptolyngbya sp. SIO4C1]